MEVGVERTALRGALCDDAGPPFPPPDIESPNLPQSRLGRARAPSAGMARPRAAGPGRAVGLVLALLAGGALLLAGPAEGDYQRRDYLAAVMSLAARTGWPWRGGW